MKDLLGVLGPNFIGVSPGIGVELGHLRASVVVADVEVTGVLSYSNEERSL